MGFSRKARLKEAEREHARKEMGTLLSFSSTISDADADTIKKISSQSNRTFLTKEGEIHRKIIEKAVEYRCANCLKSFSCDTQKPRFEFCPYCGYRIDTVFNH